MKRFPPGAVECRRGDHLLREEPDGRWRVYRVRDIVALERLVPSLTQPVALRSEADLLDSMAPAYAGEIYLLVDALEPGFGTVEEAVQALRTGPLSECVSSLLQPAAAFPAASTHVVPATPAEAAS